MRRRGFAGGVAVLLFCSSRAHAGPDLLPLQKDICKAGVADKSWVAASVATAYSIPWWKLAPYADQIPATASEQVLADDKVCGKAGAEICTKTVEKALGYARSNLATLLTLYPQVYRTSANVTVENFFSDASIQLTCVPAAKSQVANEAPGANTTSPKKSLPFMVRGSPDGLYYSQADDAPYKALPKANLAIGDDGTSHKQSSKLVGTLSFKADSLVNEADANTQYGIYPYVFFDRDLSKTAGKAQAVTNDFYSLGLSGFVFLDRSFGESHTPIAQWLGIRPDYLFDFTDHSKILSINAVYAPTLNYNRNTSVALNSWIPLLNGSYDLRVDPMLELHLDTGWYLSRGIDPKTPHADFDRLGPKFGLTFQHDTTIPVILTIADTHLFGWRGSPRTIDYLTGDLGFPLDPGQFISVDLTYGNGRDEFTFKREQTWGVTLAAKY